MRPVQMPLSVHQTGQSRRSCSERSIESSAVTSLHLARTLRQPIDSEHLFGCGRQGAVRGRPRDRMPSSGAHVMVAQTSFLGDVILTTPLLSALRRILLPRLLTVVVRPEAAPLLEHHPCVDAVVLDDKRRGDRGLGGLLRTARRLRAERADIAVAPHRSVRTALALALAGVPHRVGFTESPGSQLYHVRVPRDHARHDVERNLGLVRAFGGAVEDHLEAPRLVAGAAAARSAAQLLAEVGVGDGRALYGVCPGSVWPTKRWGAEGYGAVVRALRKQDDAQVLLLGGADDIGVSEAVQRHAGGSAVNLVGRTDLGTFVALVERLDALVSNDSAPMHVASALGVPVVAVFCATTPAQGYGPYGTRAALVGADLECRPCGRHGGRRCPRGTEDCMRLVGAADVLKALRSLCPGPRASASL
jgi:heptosyltransferase-2